MARGVDQVRSFLAASGILDSTLIHETCVVIVPSRRVKSGTILHMLRANDIPVRSMGHGTGKIRDRFGIERKVKGLLVLAIPTRYLRVVEMHAKLCGVHVVRINKVADSAK